MTTLDQAEAQARPQVAETSRRPRRPGWRATGGATSSGSSRSRSRSSRSLYIVSAAFNGVDSLSSASLIPDQRHARQLPPDPERLAGRGGVDRCRARRPVRELVREHARHLGRCPRSCPCSSRRLAAYAFAASASAAAGWGCSALLLIQMFPTFLAVVAIYLIVLRRRRRVPRDRARHAHGRDPRLPRRARSG